MKVGDKVKTVGGWEAIIIWICSNDLCKGFYAIHKPLTKEESGPIYHFEEGKPGVSFAVNEAPCYDIPHPATIIIQESTK